MSCGNKLSNVWTSVLRSGEGLTSFNKNNRVNFSGEKKIKMKLFLVSFFRIHRLRVLCPSRKTHETRKWPRAWLKARDWRGTLARACTALTKWTARSLVGEYTEKTESQIDLLLVLGSEGLYLCTEKEGLLALALVTYLRAYISIKRHICDVGRLNYDNIMTPSGCLLVCVSLSIFIT